MKVPSLLPKAAVDTSLRRLKERPQKMEQGAQSSLFPLRDLEEAAEENVPFTKLVRLGSKTIINKPICQYHRSLVCELLGFLAFW